MDQNLKFCQNLMLQLVSSLQSTLKFAPSLSPPSWLGLVPPEQGSSHKIPHPFPQQQQGVTLSVLSPKYIEQDSHPPAATMTHILKIPQNKTLSISFSVPLRVLKWEESKHTDTHTALTDNPCLIAPKHSWSYWGPRGITNGVNAVADHQDWSSVVDIVIRFTKRFSRPGLDIGHWRLSQCPQIVRDGKPRAETESQESHKKERENRGELAVAGGGPGSGHIVRPARALFEEELLFSTDTDSRLCYLPSPGAWRWGPVAFCEPRGQHSTPGITPHRPVPSHQRVGQHWLASDHHQLLSGLVSSVILTPSAWPWW